MTPALPVMDGLDQVDSAGSEEISGLVEGEKDDGDGEFHRSVHAWRA